MSAISRALYVSVETNIRNTLAARLARRRQGLDEADDLPRAQDDGLAGGEISYIHNMCIYIYISLCVCVYIYI